MDIIIEEQADQGSLKAGLAGETEFRLGDVLKEAWERTDGNKRTVWFAMAFYIGLALLISIFFGLLGGSPEEQVAGSPNAIEQIGNLVSALVLMPITVGLTFLGVAIARGYSPNPKSVLGWYGETLRIFLLAVLMNVMIVLGLLLFVIPGIYLAVSYQIALPLMIDKKLGLWEALESSRKVIGHHWFAVLGYDIVLALLLAISSLLLGVPLIWTIPLAIISFGVLYRNLVGVEADTLQRVLAQEDVPA
ncbi:hypothetical protein EY643_09120 [Halioglobus maricola]|uniref:DUF975 family protein n=1 Tax=Halioglobus maricola TaxID=2601894 RepID=A0A5P9NIW7_9GAMM|nr:hypothetical protein [Halioglobus maricola]QFU75803.1 hypothetical protein EY643_09120 [Halioglobus maricola]